VTEYPDSVCVDASLVLKLLLPEPGSDSAATLWSRWEQEGIVKFAPAHFLYETC